TWHWPAFNVADSAITLGVILLLVTSFREELSKKAPAD
ncbi:MAG: signal peptidase II, partial [Phenylobacterium sp.]|nr:signal peptidase II [Phenylobacterium sp.]